MQNITVEFIPGESKENINQTEKFLICTSEELSKLSATSLVLLQSIAISVFFFNMYINILKVVTKQQVFFK
jgi:hypothetical protein